MSEPVSESAITTYYRYLAAGEFRLQRRRSGGGFFFHPRNAAPGDGETDLEWERPCGLGRVYSTTVVRMKLAEDCYNVALIELDEGPRMMSRVIGQSPESVKIGLRVRAEIAPEGAGHVVVFRATEEEA